MNILLTGSGGFIGKNLKNHLADKFNLLCPRSFELDLTKEISVKTFFLENDIDLIIHCSSVGGSRGIQDKNSTIENNLAMVNNLIYAKKDCCKIILFGSGAMYGKDRNLCKIKESQIGEYIPKDLYGISKYEISKIVKDRNDILMLNIFGCYGYEEKENRFPSYAINQALENNPIEINQNCIFDYLFVEDMTKIVTYFIEHRPKNKIINITPTKSISLLEIANIVKEISKKDIKIKIKNEVMNYNYTGDNTILLKEIPNFSFIDYKNGIKKLYKYISAQKTKEEEFDVIEHLL